MDKKCDKSISLTNTQFNILRNSLLRFLPGMALLGSNIANEVGLRLLLCPLGSNIVARTACCSVGIVLPVYHTFKAIERKDENEEQKWLMYWAAYGSFTLAEAFADQLISWFPMYYHMKFAFLVWLQLPSAEGAKQLYTNHLRPFLLRHQARVDLIMGLAYGEMVKLICNHQKELVYAKRMLLKVMGSADHMLKDAPNHRGILNSLPSKSRQEQSQRLNLIVLIEIYSSPFMCPISNH